MYYDFLPNAYTVNDHLVTNEAEFRELLQDAPQHIHAKAKQAMTGQNLYRMTLSYEDDAIEQDFYPNVYSLSVPEVQSIFEAMSLVPTCKTLSVFM